LSSLKLKGIVIVAPLPSTLASSLSSTIQNLLVIDRQVIDWQSLAAGAGADTAVLILDSGTDGLTQISDYLSNASASGLLLLQSIQIISHGSAGSLQLGSSRISSSNLGLYTKQLAKIGSSLTDTGDILLYGCNVAAGQVGLDFINQFAALTNADVAASNDITGSAALGGNWWLEASTGSIEVALSLNTAILNTYTSILPSDTTAPTLTSLTFPTTIDLSSGNQLVSFAAHAEDAVSGVDTVNVWFDKSLTSDVGSHPLWMISSGWIDSTPSDASVGWTVQSYNNPGIYNITGVDVKDLAGNSRSYTPAQLSSLGIATSFNVTDGVFIQNALTATPSMEQGKIIISLSAAQWSASSNSLAFTLAYDSPVVHFDSWRAGSSGSYAVSSSILEVGASTTVSMTTSISNSGDKTDFIQLVFTTTAQQGNFAYNFSSETLNSQTLANISGNYSFIVIDTTAPTVTSFNPTDGETAVAIASNINLIFSEAIQKGTGTIAIHSGSAGGAIVESFDAATSNLLSISGNTLTINPSADLGNNIQYFVTFAAGSVKDLAVNNYAGTSTYDFTTVTNVNKITDGNDVLVGTNINDKLNGGKGADSMKGGLGSDTYYVDNIGDKVIENKSAGTDTVYSSISFILGPNVENLTLTSKASINGTGNAINNTLIGNSAANKLSGLAGNDILNGGLGKDILTGGTGKDIFQLTTLSKDTITDFSVKDDTLQLENSVFGKLIKTGVLSAANFKVGAATDNNDYVLYNSSTGVVSYDANGNGAGGTTQIAVLGAHLALTHLDFFVI
jgi:Ca2+-binding RTX toxin-like protein